MADLMPFYPCVLLAFVVGTVLGSFVTMASYRLPREEDIVVKPSYCPRCNTKLEVPDLFPLLSWLLARGKCRHCAAPISLRYPLTELTLGLVSAGVFWRFGASFDTLFLILLATLLMILIVTDLEAYIIPDGLQIALLVLGVAYDAYHQLNPWQVLESMLLGLGIGAALHYGYRFLRHKDGLGMGDVKFLAVAGVWLPLINFVPFLFFSGVLGTIMGLLWRWVGRGHIFPFGPALAVTLFVLVLFPTPWISLLL